MHDELDARDIAMVRERLGPLLAELHQTMLDLDAPPVFLFGDDRPRLVATRAQAVQVLDQWASESPEEVAGIYSRLPDVLQSPSTSEALLVATTWAAYFEVPIDLFDIPAPNSRVFTAAPDLVPLLDESGLVTVSSLDARPWGLHTGKYAFQYHQLLRRGFRSGIHYELVDAVLRLADQHQLVARLALDERRVRFKDEYVEFFEHDRWYGRALDEDDLDSLAAVGETFHGDPNGGTSLLNPYAGLAVRWTADGVLKTVEIEEFMPPPGPGAEWVFARYLHAIRDTSTGVFVHCDGAVKAFAADAYPRTQNDFGVRGKGDRYRKLFRVDGEFPASAWSTLACSWFRGNALVLEYFDSCH